ncbi:MAG TPA: VOC family protein [Gemmatimonadales bacterium]
MKIESLTPVLVVDEVEPCIAFWVNGLGFVQENAVPGADGKLVFASVKRDSVEVMYQTRASVVADTPSMANYLGGHPVVLFLTVDDIDAVEQAVTGAPVFKPRHDTFYGSIEIYVREPGGHVVGFAQFKPG